MAFTALQAPTIPKPSFLSPGIMLTITPSRPISLMSWIPEPLLMLPEPWPSQYSFFDQFIAKFLFPKARWARPMPCLLPSPA